MAALTELESSFDRSVAVDMSFMIQWFTIWTNNQRMTFLESVVPKVVPHKLFAMASRLTLQQSQTDDYPSNPLECNCFEQQLKFCHLCLDRWTADDCNHFMNLLEDVDRPALYRFYDMIAATVGEL